MQRPDMGGGFGVRVTPLARGVLIALVSIYVAQLVAVHWLRLPIDRWLYLWPVGSGNWAPWQPFTALLLNNHIQPLVAALDWLMLAFFIAPVQDLLGTQRFKKAIATSVVIAVVATTLLDLTGALLPHSQFVGLNPIITALIVLFGLSIPHARILLFFVIPIRAGWVAWGSGLIILLYFLSQRDLGSSLALFGWVGAWAWLNSGDWWTRLRRRKQARDMEKELSRFTVLQGGRDDEYIH